MRSTILAILALAVLAGCGEVRTSATWSEDVPASPIYAAPIAKVHDAAAAACMEYFGEVDEDDRVAHRIVNDNFAFWVGGRTITTLTMVAISDKQTRVDLDSHGAFPAGFFALGGRERYIIRWLIHRLDKDLPRATGQPIAAP